MTQQVEQGVDGRRWGVGIYVAITAVLSLAQAGALGWGAQGAAPEAGLEAWLPALGVVAVLQLLKIPGTRARLLDLGRPADEALSAVVPVLNVVLFVQLLSGTPSEELRARRIRSWSTQVGAFGAYRRALPWLLGSASVALPVTLLAGTLGALGAEAYLELLRGNMEGGGLSRLGDIGLALLGLGLVWTVLQLPKRARATRRSWAGTLLIAPGLALTLAARAAPMAAQGGGGIVLALVVMSWELLVTGVVGGLCAAVWVVAARRVQAGEPLSGVLGEAWGHAADVVVVWAGRNQLVLLGGQVIVPGVWFGVSYALADLAAIVEPERPSFARSVELVRGIRGKIFRMLVLWFVGTSCITLGLASVELGPAELTAMLVDPDVLSTPVVVARQVVTVLGSWWCALAMLAVYDERRALWALRHGDASAPPVSA